MNKKGFTLIELVLYIGITAIILTASLSLAWSVIFNQTKTTALIETNYNYQFLDNFLGTDSVSSIDQPDTIRLRHKPKSLSFE